MTGSAVPGSHQEQVILVTTSYPTHPGDPSGHFVATEARALARSGAHVRVLAPSVAGRRAPGVEHRDGVEVRWLPAGDAFGAPGAWVRLRERPLRTLGALRFAHAARRELARSKAARVVAHFLVPSAWPITRGLRTRLDVIVHGSDLALVEKLPRPVRASIAQHLAAATIRCVSAELRDRLGHALGAQLAERARVEPSPLELEPVPDRRAARATLGNAPDARLVVVVGRLVASKRARVALTAGGLVPGAELVVVGDGPERSELERAFPEARFLGAVERPRALAWLSAADVLLSASEREGAPSVVREARALGTRVVTLPAGDLEMWSRSDHGLTVLSGAL
jgi:glycosyltransferase involved in cell wall biosynthesis